MCKLSVIIIIISSILFTQCKKYPEGPSISFRSKKERLANTWKISAYKINDVDSTTQYTSVYKDYTLTMTKSGSYSISLYITVPVFGNISNTESGIWKLSSDKKELTITPQSVVIGTLASPTTLQILKLYEKELWLRNFDKNGRKIEYHFIPK